MPLLALFILVPLIEIALFIQLGSILDLGWILLIVVLTAIVGTYLVRQQGMGVLRQVQSSMGTLNDPAEPLAHGAMILFAGALLLTPGFFTDTIGFLLLAPPFRRWAFAQIRKRMTVVSAASFTQAQRPSQTGGQAPHGPDVIDGDYADVTETRKSSDGPPSGWTRH